MKSPNHGTPAAVRPASRRRHLLWGLASLAVSGCGGGSSGTEPPAMRGSTEAHVVTSRANGNTYPLQVYLPPERSGKRHTLPVLYALDGDWWFTQLVDIAEATQAGVIVVGIGNNANRATDYVPANTCTSGGGGQAAFLAFIRNELIAYVEQNVGGDPARRALLGHSHGGSFVYFALFSDAPGSHPFKAYLASDASTGCTGSSVDAWESAYAASYAVMPVRLHLSHTPINNAEFAMAQRIRGRGYAQLVLAEKTYNGTHTGIIPAAFADALAFAFAP